MSYTEVRRLIDEGRLSEAINVAKYDIQQENNEWSCLGLFDVMKECCINEINNGNNDNAEKYLKQLEVVARGLADPIKAGRIIEGLRSRMIPNSRDMQDALKMARQGGAKEAYEEIYKINHTTGLDTRLHESYGQLIYYYLREGLRTMGGQRAQDVLNEYLSLKNDRPSSIHSSIANMASHVCGEYSEVKLLPFIEAWDVRNLLDEDMKPVTLQDRTIAPLSQRLIDRCISLGYSIESVVDVFSANERITYADVIDRICRKGYSMIYEATKQGSREVIEAAERYTKQIEGQHINNQYHSKALNSIISSLNSETIGQFASIMEKWNPENFRDEDWTKIRRGSKEIPSLSQRALAAYIDSMKACKGEPSEMYENWLHKAIERDPKNDTNQRQLAKLFISQGKRNEAVEIYRKLLITMNKYYTWYELAMATDDKDLKRSALCKALVSEQREERLGDIHLELAKVLIEDGMQNEAARELLSYYNTCTQFQIGLKPAYDTLLKSLQPDTEATQTNKAYYLDNTSIAEGFILGEAEELEMKAIEISKKKGKLNNRDYVSVTLVSENGVRIMAGPDKFKVAENEIVGKSYIVKYAQNDSHIKVIETTQIDKEINLLPLKRIGYIDGLDKTRNVFHIYDTESMHFVADANTTTKIGDFVEFLTINSEGELGKAVVIGSISYKEGVELYPTYVGVVARVDYNKRQFNCVCETGVAAMVSYDSGSDPQPGQMLRVAYITKTNKAKDTSIVKYISVEPSEETCEKLKKDVTGPIHKIVNEKNFEYGFINFEDQGYYVSGFQMKDKNIEEGDIVTSTVVCNGDNWFAINLTKN